MKTNNNISPTAMTRIVNIQTMLSVIKGSNYNDKKDFKRLSNLTEDELWTEQCSIVNTYNDCVTERQNELKK